MSKFRTDQQVSPRRAAWNIALIYALLAGLWIGLSDSAVRWLTSSPDQIAFLSMIKGWGFVAVTASMLFLLVRRYMRDLEIRNQTLEVSETKARQMAQSRQILLRELDHRVKNNLASLFALVGIYEKQAPSTHDLAELVRAKILALKWTHEALAGSRWSSLDLTDIVLAMAATESPRQDVAESLNLDIPKLNVPLRQASAMAMVFHELFSNSRKHGALSVPTGQVHIVVRPCEPVARGTPIEITWRETGGPAAVLPIKHGVGMKLIEGLIHFELAGDAQLQTTPTGIHWRLTATLDHADAQDQAAA